MLNLTSLNKVIPLSGDGDNNPCLEMTCGADSYCVAREEDLLEPSRFPSFEIPL